MIGTCSPLEQMCKVAGRKRLSYASNVNSLSPKTSVIVKPLLRYFLMTNFNYFLIINTFLLGR